LNFLFTSVTAEALRAKIENRHFWSDGVSSPQNVK